MDKKLFNQWLSILGQFLETNPEVQGGEKLTALLSLLGAAIVPRVKKKAPTKAFRQQIAALTEYLPDRPNVVFDMKALIEAFPLLDEGAINRMLGGPKCLGRYRQYCPTRNTRGAVTGWCFDPKGDNEYIADLEYDYIHETAAKQKLSADTRLTRLESYFDFGRALGMENNPKALAQKAAAEAQVVEQQSAAA